MNEFEAILAMMMQAGRINPCADMVAFTPDVRFVNETKPGSSIAEDIEWEEVPPQSQSSNT